MRFEPKFSITPTLATTLMRIEAARQAVADLPITPSVLATLRETARLYSTHYSTMIEGNRLTQEQVSKVIEKQQHFAGRERDEKEVLGYYAALEKAEQIAASGAPVSEVHIQTLHALVMAEGRRKAKTTPYRDGQNVIRDSRSRSIVYMPPEAKDVPPLMVSWISRSQTDLLPCPLRAGIAHYQFATIHPWYDGNGRTARLLTTLILHLGGYDLKGLYSLEEYYARSLGDYYNALTVGPSHNYYEGRAEADITAWVEYFCDGVADSFENVRGRAQEAGNQGARDQSNASRQLDPRQCKALELFREATAITSRDLKGLFGISQRASRNILSAWVDDGFVVIADPAKKTRRYGLSTEFIPKNDKPVQDNASMPLPNSLPWMESADAKMIRARENIEGIRRELDEWFSTIQINTYLKTSPDHASPWLVVHANDYIPPIRLSILIGECVHNMRSAVDNLVCGLALTVKPRCKCHGLAFPLVKDQAEWNEKADNSLKGVPPAAKEIIRELQPWADKIHPNPLAILNRLNNLDKHRACNFTLAYGRNVAFVIYCNDGSIVTHAPETPLYLGDVYDFVLPISKTLVQPSARVQLSGNFVVTFREESDWDDKPVMQILYDCFDHVEHQVMGRLKPFFESTHFLKG